MRKPNLSILLGILLLASMSANLMLAMRQRKAVAKARKLDNRLMASWKSVSPPGYRLIFDGSGQFVLTDYGMPLGIGTWSVDSGRLIVLWEIDEDEVSFEPQSTSYDISKDGRKLQFAKAIVTGDAKAFTRANGFP